MLDIIILGTLLILALVGMGILSIGFILFFKVLHDGTISVYKILK